MCDGSRGEFVRYKLSVYRSHLHTHLYANVFGNQSRLREHLFNYGNDNRDDDVRRNLRCGRATALCVKNCVLHRIEETESDLKLIGIQSGFVGS